jgi:hypothetical protein
VAAPVVARGERRIEEDAMRRALVVAVTLVLVLAAGTADSLLAQTSSDPLGLEGRIVNVNGEMIQLADGTVVRVPLGLASPQDLREGRAVKIRYEVKDKEYVATGIDFPDSGAERPGTRRP